MKRFVGCLLGGIVLAGASPALAADLPMAPVYSPRPEVASQYSWNGCFIGVQGGYGTGPFKWWDPNPLPRGDEFFGSGTQKGGIAGGQVGCNYQFPNHFVLGLEADILWSGIGGSFTTGEPADTNLTYTTKTNWLSTAAVRGGYAWDRNLFYLKGGAGFGGMSHSAADPEAGGAVTLRGSETRAGYVLGVGAERALAKK